MGTVQVDVADRVHVLVQDRDLVALLDDLERVRHVGDARHARHVALRLGIVRQALPEILLAQRERRRQVRNLPALDDPLPSGHAELRRMIFDVPDGGIERLPDALQIGMPVGRTRHAVRLLRKG